jgi:hypothetical protein
MMNRAISVCGGPQLDDFSATNGSGMYRRKACGVDPFGSSKRHILCYYVTTPGNIVERPKDGKRSILELLEDASLHERYRSVARSVPEVVDLTLAISNQQQALATKRKIDIMDAPMEDAEDNTENNSGKRRATNVDETTEEEESYWDSPEAKKLFLGTTTDERSVQE